jgi:hypothetical protein
MPVAYILLHLVLVALASAAALRFPSKSRVGLALGVLLAAVAVLGFVVERHADWAWRAMALGLPDLVFLTNQSLATACVLAVILWRSAKTAAERRRAWVLGGLLVCASLWSYAWYFAPLPDGLTGKPDATGFCKQTTPDSCSAAAAATLLAQHGISTNEEEMAELCLTRRGFGTTPLGLYRGLTLKAAAKGLRPVPILANDVAELGRRNQPAITTVGLQRGAPPEVEAKMLEYGWGYDFRHDVVALTADPAGAWIEVADPSYGKERWPTKDIEYIWDRWVLVLTTR